MNRSLCALALCLLSSAATYGSAPLDRAAEAIGADINSTGRTTCLAAAEVGHAVAANLRKAANAVATKCQPILNSERVKAAQALLAAKFNATRTYIKENPAKSVLIYIGATAVTGVVCATILKIRRAIKKYHADHTTFCNCCGREIAKKETRYKDPQDDAHNCDYYYCGCSCHYLCANCYDRIVSGKNKAHAAYWHARGY